MRYLLLLTTALLGSAQLSLAGDILLRVNGTVETLSGPASSEPVLAALQPGDTVTATYYLRVPGTPRSSGGVDYSVDTGQGQLETPTGTLGGAPNLPGTLFVQDAPGVDILSMTQDLAPDIELLVATIDFSSMLIASQDLATLAGTTSLLPASITTRLFAVRNGATTIEIDPVSISFEDAGGIGTNYCVAANNSSGAPAQIEALGSSSAVANDVTLRATDLPSNVFGFFIVSRTRGFVANPAGSAGNLCLSGSIGRFVGPGLIQNSGGAGQFELGIDLTAVPEGGSIATVVAGDTWNFQAWLRDSAGGVATSNFSNGVEIIFQ